MQLLKKIKDFRHKAYIWFWRHTPVQKNKVLFWADSFRHFGCSPKYIALELLRKYPGQFDLVWVFDAEAAIPEDLPEGIRTVRYFSMQYLKELHTAKFVVCNMRTGSAYYWHKRPDQLYLQTWHSSLRLKKIEGDAADKLPPEYIASSQEDSRKIDLLLSGCRFSTDIFRRAFWYDGEILPGGTPRCDVLLQDTAAVRKKVFASYGIPKDRKLVLYAPTFRNDRKADTFGMDFARLRSVLEERGERWVVGCRLHPNILADFSAEGCISMSRYSDMQELIAAADLLITDYSSCMFDMAIAGKPCMLYAPDLEQYLAKERGLYFDLRALPFPIAESMDALCESIRCFDAAAYQQARQQFMGRIGSFEDGHAAERAADWIRMKSER